MPPISVIFTKHKGAVLEDRNGQCYCGMDSLHHFPYHWALIALPLNPVCTHNWTGKVGNLEIVKHA